MVEAVLAPCPRCTKPLSPLTPQQLRVIALLADGLNLQEIAERLCLGRDTAKQHVSRAKLVIADDRAKTSAGLVAYCLRAGWLS